MSHTALQSEAYIVTTPHAYDRPTEPLITSTVETATEVMKCFRGVLLLIVDTAIDNGGV